MNIWQHSMTIKILNFNCCLYGRYSGEFHFFPITANATKLDNQLFHIRINFKCWLHNLPKHSPLEQICTFQNTSRRGSKNKNTSCTICVLFQKVLQCLNNNTSKSRLSKAQSSIKHTCLTKTPISDNALQLISVQCS